VHSSYQIRGIIAFWVDVVLVLGIVELPFSTWIGVWELVVG
jgi:hypothetical protein